ncbi:MOSC domain-containing protein [Shewanella sp. FJAT-52076]|uniref:MOSC domain-containing protein n=1 Tax=Shewanella sp. FJAT-52076 TaxID=2864202 RepID=UPI001C658708|nr:MOSC domain-containing protein [Shewanella sp. FJAT-52076]QYJ75273.1 MOSC domain-containing protein [Shewanella sp. FJAT-52076]
MSATFITKSALYRGTDSSQLGQVSSGIAHKQRAAVLQVTAQGIVGDAQVDTRHHGGPDRAVHHFPREHYGEYRRRDMFRGFVDAPAMGENISTVGLTEETLHIGDILSFGSTVLQVTQPRSPCFKLDLRFAYPGFALVMQTLGKSGWFYRVLTPGEITETDTLQLKERLSDISVADAMQCYFAAEFHETGYRRLLACPGLAQSWRNSLEKRLASGKIEDWRPRLMGQGQ